MNIRAWWRKQQFLPTVASSPLHPSYIIRRGLAKGIAHNADLFTGRVLDFGCGSKPYRSLFHRATEYVGVDIQASGHDHQELGSEVDIFYDGETLPFEDASFDAVIAFEVFEHIFLPDPVIREIGRVLRPGGRIMITTPFVWPEHEEPYDYARYSSFGMKSLFERQGFHVERVEKIGNASETVFQLLSNVVAQRTGDWSRIPRLLFQVGLVFPLNAVGILIGKMIKDNKRLYSNNLLIGAKATG